MPRIRIDNVRLSFPELWTPKAIKAGDKPACSATALFPPDHPAAKLVNDAIEAAATEKWKGDAKDMLEALRAQDRVCIHNGALKAKKYEGYAGMLFVNARNPVPPTVKDLDPKAPNLTAASGRPYSGCRVNMVLDIYAQDNSFGQRVNATLVGVQFAGDDTAFAGGSPAADDDFAPMEEGSEEDFFG